MNGAGLYSQLIIIDCRSLFMLLVGLFCYPEFLARTQARAGARENMRLSQCLRDIGPYPNWKFVGGTTVPPFADES